MPEQEELRLTVTLVDNASAGLMALRTQTQQFSREFQQLTGGHAAAQMEAFKRGQTDLAGKIKDVTNVAVGGERALLGFIGKFGVAGAAVASFGTLAGIAAASAKSWAEGVTNLAVKSQMLGTHAADIETLYRQMEKFKITNEETDQALGALNQTMAALADPGSAMFKNLRDLAGPQFLETFVQFKEELEGAKDDAEKLNVIIRGRIAFGETAYNQARAQGQNEDTANRRRIAAETEFLEAVRQTQALRRAQPTLQAAGPAAKAAMDEQIKAATSLNTQFRETEKTMERIYNYWKVGAGGEEGWLNKSLEKTNELLGNVERSYLRQFGTEKQQQAYDEREREIAKREGREPHLVGAAPPLFGPQPWVEEQRRQTEEYRRSLTPDQRKMEEGPRTPSIFELPWWLSQSSQAQPPAAPAPAAPAAPAPAAPADEHRTPSLLEKPFEWLKGAFSYANPIGTAHAETTLGMRAFDTEPDFAKIDFKTQLQDNQKQLGENTDQLKRLNAASPAAAEPTPPQPPAQPPAAEPAPSLASRLKSLFWHPPAQATPQMFGAAQPERDFGHTDWPTFESKARPSSLIEDARKGVYAPDVPIQPVGTDQQWIDTIMALSSLGGGAMGFLGSAYRGLGLAGVGGRVNPLAEPGPAPSLRRQGILDPTHERLERARTEEIGRQTEKFRDSDEGPMLRRDDRSDLDRRFIDTVKPIQVEGTGTLTANITAPAGTRVGLEAGGLFRKTQLNRQTQMALASTGPPNPAYSPTLEDFPL